MFWGYNNKIVFEYANIFFYFNDKPINLSIYLIIWLSILIKDQEYQNISLLAWIGEDVQIT